jgi:hypothetical protein
MALKPIKTPADYMAMAACPALIMVLVGSLVFFLLQIGYAGESLGRLQWTLFWFVFAMVLVSRIAIERSPGAAFLYGLALAAATSLLLTQYIGFLWGVWLLLALIWWACNQMVFDCTLIDDEQDASGQGLLQHQTVARWLRTSLVQVRAVPSPPASNHAAAALITPRIPPPRQQTSTLNARRTAPPKALKKQELHAPGLWVLYFSFAAVPVFGLGEILLRSNDIAGRRFAFVLLFCYVASALVLLLLTSFLGLRRYLRQRYLVMPGSIASTWITQGAVLLLAVLVVSLLLPRPVTPYSLADFVPKLTSPLQTAPGSAPDRSSGSADAKSGEANRGERAQQPAHAGESDGKSAELRERSVDAATSTHGGSQPSPSLPHPRVPGAEWLSYLLSALILIYVAYRFWPEIRAALKAILAALADFFGSGTRPRSRRRARRILDDKLAEPLPLLADPFQNGRFEQMSLAELVLYSFEGVKRWACTRGFALEPSETALEMAERLARHEPALRNEVLLLSSYYSHLAFANEAPLDESVVVLKRLWSVIGFGGSGSRPRTPPS